MAVSICTIAAQAEELTGYVSDAMCGAKHHEVSEANTKCVTGCLKHGDPVLVSGDKVMKFDKDSVEKAKTFAGQNVKIDGSVDGDTVKITSIDKAGS
jgi:hypothetical protein